MAKKQTTHGSRRNRQTSADVRQSAGHQGPGLTPRQARFVAEYLMDLSGTQAAIRAGYSPQTANAQWATVEAKAACAAIVDDPVYRTKLMAAARARTVAPAVEVMLWHYAYGKPKERVEHSGHLDLIHGRT